MLKFSLGFLNKNKPPSNPPQNDGQVMAGGAQNAQSPDTVAQYIQPQAQNPTNQTSSPLENHRAVLRHFNQLMRSGYNQEAIQAQWQQYYNNLTDEEKRSIWQNVNTQPSQQIPVHSTQGIPVNQLSVEDPYDIDDRPVVQPINKQVDYNTYTEDMDTKKGLVGLRSFFSTPVSVKKYNIWSLGSRQKDDASTENNPNPPAAPVQSNVSQDPMNTVGPTADPVHNPNIGNILPDKNLKHKTRNMLNWNSSTALFDKGESKSIWRQNIKSIAFGLTIGVVVLIVWQFSFFNERYLLPFIQPSSSSTDSQIIIPPGSTKISDPDFKIIIPKLNITAPIITDIEGYKSIDPSESEGDFESRVQQSLEGGTIHYPGTPLPGQSGIVSNSNFVVLGHSGGNQFAPGDYKFVFSKLRQMDIDDLILVNYENVQYVYKVYGYRVVEPTEVEVLKSGKINNTLTLITCDPPGTVQKRLIILARQVNPDPDNNKDIEIDDSAGETIVPGKSQGFFR